MSRIAFYGEGQENMKRPVKALEEAYGFKA